MAIGLYVIGRPSLDSKEVDRFLRDCKTSWRRSKASPSEHLVEIAGRMCYMSFGKSQSPKSNKQYVSNLIAHGHESVLEHVNWTLVLTGVSRAFTHQLVRHRPGVAFSQLSQQYHDETNAEFVEPAYIQRTPGARRVWIRSVANALTSYENLLTVLSRGTPLAFRRMSKKEFTRLVRSAARSVLPNATATKIVISANARALRHFLNVRGSIVGDEEMRRVCAALFRVLSAEAPSFFSDFAIRRLADGSPCVIRKSARPFR